MNSQITEKYELSFENRVFDFGAFGKQIRKSLNINNPTVGGFLISWSNPQDITDLLIPDINHVINGTATLRENGSETITVDIEPNTVTFYIDDVGTNYPKIPTSDFLQIVTDWRDFLQQAPLNGTTAK